VLDGREFVCAIFGRHECGALMYGRDRRGTLRLEQ
jgi:hypothetical protein